MNIRREKITIIFFLHNLSAFLHNDDYRFLIEHKGNLEVLYNYLLLKNDVFFEIVFTYFIELLSGDLLENPTFKNIYLPLAM